MRVGLNPDAVFHGWSGEYVVYHRGSGDTRLLDHMAASIVELLLMHPQTREEIKSALRQRETAVPKAEWQEEFDACLANLFTLGVLSAH